MSLTGLGAFCAPSAKLFFLCVFPPLFSLRMKGFAPSWSQAGEKSRFPSRPSYISPLFGVKVITVAGCGSFSVRTSDSGIELIKRFEGLELEAYQDIAGIWTIGFGHTGADVEPGMKISERDAEELLRRDLKPREQAVDSAVKVGLNQNEFDALISFVYNVGAAAFRSSTALKRLNKGDRIGAADAITWWNKATVGGVLRVVVGLTRRRASERALFLTPTQIADMRDPEQFQENTRTTPVEDTPRRGNVAESRTVQGAAIAGGAGVAASTMGKDDATELDQMETNIENGQGYTDKPGASVSATPPATTNDTGSEATGGQTTGDQTTGGQTEGQTTVGDTQTNAQGDGQTSQDQFAETGQMIEVPDRPSKHEIHAVQAQVQFSLLILIILSVLFVIYARFDDWRNYRR